MACSELYSSFKGFGIVSHVFGSLLLVDSLLFTASTRLDTTCVLVLRYLSNMPR